MYKLRGIEKSYKKRGVSRVALRHVDLDLPKAGLFAVVGESGSGKSTLLNILSCLVLPDKGSIEIDGTDATKFRNSNRCGFVARNVGFVFQEDELISHATILENMQTALTLAGFDKDEVIEKSDLALRDAGLSEFKNCIPEQLSKCQLRAFSFARARAKDAKIILFDEPEIGLAEIERQNLIQEIKCASAGALVIVATRDVGFAQALKAEVINIEDGVVNHIVDTPDAPSGDTIINDDDCAVADNTSTNKPSTASTANTSSAASAVRVTLSSKLKFVRLSLRNRSGRSIVLGLSAMLGIIALAFVFAISNGITTYIDTNNRDNLSQQPLKVGTLGFNSTELTDLLTGNGSTQLSTSELITKMARTAKNNDLKSFKSHIEDNKNEFSKYTELIDYEYGITPQVFINDTSAGTISLKTSTISELSSSYTATFASPAGFTAMARLDAKEQNYTSQYDVLQGRWPENYNELVLVLPSDRSVPGLDLSLNTADARLQRLSDTIAYFKTGIISEDKTVESFNLSIQEYMDLDLKLVSVAECYTQSEDGSTWQNNSSDEDFMKNIIANSEDLKIVGVVAPSEGATSESLSAGLWYLPSLENYIAQRAGETGIVKAQKANPDVDVFSGIRFDSQGRTFDDLANSISSSINAAFSSIGAQLSAALTQTFADIENELNSFALDEDFEFNFLDEDDDTYADDIKWDEGSISINWNDVLGTTPKDNKVIVDVDEDVIDQALLNVFSEYLTDAIEKGETPTRDGLVNYLAKKEVNEKLNQDIEKAFTTVELDDETEKKLNTFVEQNILPTLIDYMEEEYAAYIVYIEAQIKADANESLSDLRQTLNKLNSQDLLTTLGIDTALNDFFKGFDLSGTYDELDAFLSLDEASEDETSDDAEETEDTSSGQIDPKTKKYLDRIVKISTKTRNTYLLNMKALGYSDFTTPSTIRFYTPTYEDRIKINNLISSYNNSVDTENNSSKHIDYYDLVDTITSISIGIVQVVSLISVVLLLLSGLATTLTIGAITFFSSRDRWRETSVLRVLGATRLNVFATLILEGAAIGLLSAAVGFGVTALLSMPINSSTITSAGFNIMIFEPWHVVVLLALGIVSMMVGYLIPAIVVSRKDAVSALRAR